MKVLIVDDEPLARKRLARLVARIAGATVVGEAANGREALEQIRALRPDVALLDIRMPGLDGLAVARALPAPVQVIFTTAYDEYAVRAFEANAVDYVLKPVQQARLEEAFGRVRQRSRPDATWVGDIVRQVLEQRAGDPELRVTARLGNTIRVFDPRQIARFHAEDRYTVLQHEGQEFLLDEPLNALETRLAPLGFVRVHRAELVNLHRVLALRVEDGVGEVELVGGERAPVSRRQIGELKRRLGLRDVE